uniref:Thyroxine-binding globulin n=1 Tax=Neolamprologus brichardi TaxID=32507 RepID=A0A3Q4H3W2_NEOBR
MPKFSIATNASLRNILQEMGITSAFENIADFSAVSNKFPLKVSKASHKATISVTEMGTEAALENSPRLPISKARLSLPPSVRNDGPSLAFIFENSAGSYCSWAISPT